MAETTRWKSGVFPIPVFQGYTSHFGRRRGPDGRSEAHTGLDIDAPLGSPVLSWWTGRVVETIDDGTCGIGVVIASGGYEQIYMPSETSASQVWAGRPWRPADRTCRHDGPDYRTSSSLGHPLSGTLARSGPDHQSHDSEPSIQQCPQCNRPLMFRVQSATLLL